MPQRVIRFSDARAAYSGPPKMSFFRKWAATFLTASWSGVRRKLLSGEGAAGALKPGQLNPVVPGQGRHHIRHIFLGFQITMNILNVENEGRAWDFRFPNKTDIAVGKYRLGDLKNSAVGGLGHRFFQDPKIPKPLVENPYQKRWKGRPPSRGF
jgi:hypothetical protein